MYEQLTFEQQLNVDADLLAGEFQFESNHRKHPVPMLRGTCAQIHVRGETLVSHYRKNLHRLAYYKPLKQTIIKRHKWTEDIFLLVDIAAHRQLNNKFFNTRKFYIKFVSHNLPLGKIVNRYDPFYLESCSSCGATTEDTLHFLTCSNPKRIQWRITLYAKLKQTMNRFVTDPALADILIDGLEAALNSQQYTNRLGNKYSTLVHDQTQIRWLQMFYGRPSHRWAQLQHSYNQSHHVIKAALNGNAWVLSILTTIWEELRVLWEIRNGNRHGVDSTTREIRKYEQAVRELKLLYDRKEEICQRDADILYPSLEIHLTHDTTSHEIRIWLNTWRPVLEASIKEAAANAIQNVLPLTTYFRTIPHSNQ